MELPTRCWKSLEQGPELSQSLLQPRGCLRSSVVSAPAPFLPAPQSVEGLLCQIPPHALAPETLVQGGPTRMVCPYGLPASSGAGNHTRPLALASAPALPHCQFTASLPYCSALLPNFQPVVLRRNSTQSMLSFRSGQELPLGSLGSCQCPLQPPRGAVAMALLSTCRTRDTGVSCASPSHVAQAVQR